MDVKSFEQLTAFDAATRVTCGCNEDLLIVLQRKVAAIELVGDVPWQVQWRYKRCRTLIVYAAFAYDFFTMAAEYAFLTNEVALRESIRQKNPERGLLLDGNAVHLTALVDVGIEDGALSEEMAVRLGLKIPEAGKFAGEAERWLGWTYATRSPGIELRNFTAHAKETVLITPPMALGILQNLADLINHLWPA